MNRRYTLTPRGERVFAALYGLGIAFATMLVILGAMLIAGAIEGGA